MTDAKKAEDKLRKSPAEMRACKSKQRKAIMQSSLMTSGDSFDSNDCARLIKRDRGAASSLLRLMESEGLVDVTKISGKNLYTAKKMALYKKKWRTCSNAFLRRRRYSRIGGVI